MGVPVVLTVNGVVYSENPPNSGKPLRFLDKTSGVSLAGPIEVETIRPAAVARVSDIIAIGLIIDQLDRQMLFMSGKDWSITSLKPMPSPSGENDGEVYLFLEKV